MDIPWCLAQQPLSETQCLLACSWAWVLPASSTASEAVKVFAEAAGSDAAREVSVYQALQASQGQPCLPAIVAILCLSAHSLARNAPHCRRQSAWPHPQFWTAAGQRPECMRCPVGKSSAIDAPTECLALGCEAGQLVMGPGDTFAARGRLRHGGVRLPVRRLCDCTCTSVLLLVPFSSP